MIDSNIKQQEILSCQLIYIYPLPKQSFTSQASQKKKKKENTWESFLTTTATTSLLLTTSSRRSLWGTTMSLSCSNPFFKRFCVDELKVEGSSCSYGGLFDTSDILPSLGATINQSTKLRKHIVSPFDPRYRWGLVRELLPLLQLVRPRTKKAIARLVWGYVARFNCSACCEP